MTVYDTAAKLPPIDVVRDRSRALAMLDSIVDGVYYDYSRRRGESEAASMRNGSGEEYDIVFTADGAFIRGVYHDSPMHNYTGGQLWPGLLEGLPPQFASLVHEPTFCHEDGTIDATFVLWRRSGDDRWHAGEGIDLSPADDEETDPDGAWLLDILCDGAAEECLEYAWSVYDIEMDKVAVEQILTLQPLTDEVIQALNPHKRLADLRERAAELDYPIESAPVPTGATGPA
ncbi:hypothetical protein AB0F73_29435 [Micromonospora purpureochromogenes]|uniref:hypothetical protein n=1 Tax=Micromonospora purpureochromogenes TaxID=47872 RepID=UPI003400DBA4